MDALFFLVLIFGLLYFMMIRPQQKKTQAHRKLLASLEVGDVVMTASGIYGAVAEIEDTVVWLEVAPEVELKVAKVAITELAPDDIDDGDGDEGDEGDEGDIEGLEAAETSDDEG